MKSIKDRAALLAILDAATDGPPNLSHCDITDINLADVDFKGADFHYTFVIRCDMRRANLSGCTLDFSSFSQVDLSDATLEGATVEFMRMENVLLTNANQTDVKWENARKSRVVG